MEENHERSLRFCDDHEDAGMVTVNGVSESLFPHSNDLGKDPEKRLSNLPDYEYIAQMESKISA